MSDLDISEMNREEVDIEPHEAFALLADADRFDIIRAVGEVTEYPVPFNEIYEQSNFTDSGQFNYHLDKLVGPFLQRTEDGYIPRYAARVAYRLAAGGQLSDRLEAELTVVDTPCFQCGAEELTAVYEGDRFWVRCESCGRRATVGPFPPRALTNHGADRLPDAFDQYLTGSVVRAAENVCPWCASQLSASIEPAGEGFPTVDLAVRRACDHCRSWLHTRVHDFLRFHPAVVAFYHERGVDILDMTFWEAEHLMAPQVSVTTDTEEWAARVTLTHDGDELELGVADDMRLSTMEELTAETG